MVVCLGLHPRISIATPPEFSSIHDVLSSMSFGLTRHLPLKRSLPNYSITFGSRLKSPFNMATRSENLVVTSKEETDKKKEALTSTEEAEDKKDEVLVSLPPPPEKPEPGDCCGSGCVRCVWDIYYDELEDYNNKLSPPTKSN